MCMSTRGQNKLLERIVSVLCDFLLLRICIVVLFLWHRAD